HRAMVGTAATAAALHHRLMARIPTSAPAGAINRHPSRAMGMRSMEPKRSSPLHARRLDPGHHLAEPAADLLDGVLGLALADGEELGAIRLVLEHPLARELPALDLAEDLPHLAAGLVVDDARAARVVAVLRRVRDRVAHVREAALVEQV